MRLATVSLAVFACAVLGTAAAQPAQKGGQACRADAEKFCKDVPPGGGRLVKCLAEHEAQLSPACRESMAQGKQRRAAAKQRGEEFAAACKPDADKLCQGVQPGQGRIVRCLMEKKDQLSPDCRQKIAEGEQRHPCYADTQRLCRDVRPGEGRIAECLKRNEGQLSPACKARTAQERGRGPKGTR